MKELVPFASTPDNKGPKEKENLSREVTADPSPQARIDLSKSISPKDRTSHLRTKIGIASLEHP